METFGDNVLRNLGGDESEKAYLACRHAGLLLHPLLLLFRRIWVTDMVL